MSNAKKARRGPVATLDRDNPAGSQGLNRATLAGDVARCLGYSADGEWREGCEDCMRRTSPPVDPERVWMMAPPVLVVFECESRIAP